RALLGLDPLRASLDRADFAHRGEELSRLVVAASWRLFRRRRRRPRWLRFRLGELQPLEGIVERLGLLQMSRFCTSRAFFSMNSRRGSTASPMSRLKISSDSTPSSTRT